jgi:hypothetical protein
MAMPDVRRQFLWLAVLISLLVACAREDGPAPVAWDRTRCAHCGMLISDPAFAAQRHSADGEVFHYDDPGCLLAQAGGEAAIAGDTLFFHHQVEDRWLRADETVFVESSSSPMGYGLAAVGRGEAAGGLSLEAAKAKVIARDRARSSR